MKIKASNYLLSTKPLFNQLLRVLNEDFSYVSILAEDTKAKSYSVSKNGISITNSPMLTKRGFVVRVYKDNLYAEYATNEISNKLIPEIVDNINHSLVTLTDSEFKKIHLKQVEENKELFYESSECKMNPDDISDKEIISKLIKIHSQGISNEKILNFISAYTYCKTCKLFLSNKKDLMQNIMWSQGRLMGVAKKDDVVKDYFKGYSCLGGVELIDEMFNDINHVVDTTIEILDSETIKPGNYECICTPDVTGMIVHEAFGHGVEMDMFVKDRALAKDFIGKQVASDLITMHDNANSVVESATFYFDDEGNKSNDTVIIKNGILQTGINDELTALQMGDKCTGNGRRESYERKAYTRMTNTYFEAGNDKVEDMISSIKNGFLLENPTCGMEDPKNWGIQCMVNIAREIKDGKLTGKIYSPVILSGYVPDLLKSISMVSDEIKLSGSGFCGKGHKEWVKVSDGGPYVKAKIKLG